MKKQRFIVKLTEEQKEKYMFEFSIIEEKVRRLKDIQDRIDVMTQGFYIQNQQVWGEINRLKQKLNQEEK